MATDTSISLNEQIDAIEVSVAQEAKRFIRGERRRIFERIERAAKEVAKRDGVEVTAMEIEYSELMRDFDQPFLKFLVYTGSSISPDEAFTYWDRFGKEVSEWLSGRNGKDVFDYEITYTVEWVEPDVD